MPNGVQKSGITEIQGVLKDQDDRDRAKRKNDYAQLLSSRLVDVEIQPFESPRDRAFLTVRSSAIRDSTPDFVGNAWRLRAEAATKKLDDPGLDECDKAIEHAFQHPKELISGNLRIFELKINIADQTMLATYSYEGQRLSAFGLVALPPQWLAVQKTESKTLSILVWSSNCAFDLCTNDPFMTGPCAEPLAR